MPKYLDGTVGTVSIFEHAEDLTTLGQPLVSFTIEKGNTYIVYQLGNDVCAGKKKFGYKWIAGDQYVNPHRNLKSNEECKVCSERSKSSVSFCCCC